jgi:molybdopterin-binding protein
VGDSLAKLSTSPTSRSQPPQSTQPARRAGSAGIPDRTRRISRALRHAPAIAPDQPDSFLWRRLTLYRVPHFRIAEVAALLGVSDDTVRRWLDTGQLPVECDRSRWMVVDGAALAAFAQDHAHPTPDVSQVGRSARNRFVGLVTNVITDTVMTQIELQCGPHRVVSLMSTEAARELGLEPGSLAVAVVKSTQVLIEIPNKPHTSTPEGA